MNAHRDFMADIAPSEAIPIPLVIDDAQDLDFLGPSKSEYGGPSIELGVPLEAGASLQIGIGQEKLIPREVIATAVGTTNLQAELGRPVLVGHYNEVPAFLLRTKFSFQRIGSVAGTFSRIQAAQITIVFEALGEDNVKKNELHPAVAAWYPETYEGEATEQVVGRQKQSSLTAGYMGAGLTMSMGTNTETVTKSRIQVHGVRGGGKHLNVITWSIEEDRIAKSGLPRIVSLPLIVAHHNTRFQARVTVRAHFGFWRGALARRVPVLGRNDEPLCFDPRALIDMAEEREERGPDGRLIAEEFGSLHNVDLRDFSSFCLP